MGQETVLDARLLSPRARHPRIFAAWEDLPVGGVLRLVNDHDPKPLFYEFKAERAGEFDWEPVERGPERWVVRITRLAAAKPPERSSGARPAWARDEGEVLDVREDLRAGREPFQKLMAAAAAVEPGQVLVVRALFEPRPLYAVLAREGFASWAERLGEDDWKVYFLKEPRHAGCGCGGHGGGSAREGRVLTLDVSELEPPQPMIEILQKVQELGPGDVLEVSHHREPVPLYPHLEEAGFAHEIERLGERRFRLRIRRKDG